MRTLDRLQKLQLVVDLRFYAIFSSLPDGTIAVEFNTGLA